MAAAAAALAQTVVSPCSTTPSEHPAGTIISLQSLATMPD
jgi:hypothetical protein